MNMKKVLLLPFLLLSLLLSGCDDEAIIDSTADSTAGVVTQQTTEQKKLVGPFVGFAETEVEDIEQLRKLKPEELRNYTSQYSDYNTYTYYQHLNKTEQLVYRAFEYALDEGFPYFWVDDRLLYGMERSAFEILEFFSLDSAVTAIPMPLPYCVDWQTFPALRSTAIHRGVRLATPGIWSACRGNGSMWMLPVPGMISGHNPKPTRKSGFILGSRTHCCRNGCFMPICFPPVRRV